jgi:hypothetical protein
MCFPDTSDAVLRPLARRAFPASGSSQLTWTFDFDWTRTGTEKSYALLMQLGQGSQMSDASLDAGVGVNLVWTNFSGTHETLAYRRGGSLTGLQVIKGINQVRVVADLDAKTYSVWVNNTAVGAGIAFDANVSLDTVRFLTDGLNEIYFSGRCFDNLVVEASSSTPATATSTFTATLTPTAPPVSTATFTPTATAPAASTATFTPTATATATATRTPTSTAAAASTATSTPTFTATPGAGSGSSFSDNFNRANSAVVGNNWMEAEAAGALVEIQNNRLCFPDTSDAVMRPLARHVFPTVSSGQLTWTFDFDWSRTGTERTYALWMQLGQGSQMSDGSLDAGVGVNLTWANFSGTHEMLAYRKSGGLTGLQVVRGTSQIRVVADLNAKTYSISVNGTAVGSGIPFDANVSLDTVRFMTDGLNEIYFSGRCLDNLSISTSSSPPASTSTPTGTRTATAPAASTATSTPTTTRTPTPTATGSPSPGLTCNGPIRIMPLGDSITQGSSSGETDTAKQISYRLQLWNSLISAGYNIDYVGSQVWGSFYQSQGFDPDNEGHGGWRDDQIAANIYNNGGENWLGSHPADVILLHIGTNNLNTSASDVANILNEVDQYEAAQGRPVWVILARIINRSCSLNNPPCAEAATTTTFNDNVQAMAQARINNGDKILLVDMETGAGIDYRLQPGGDMWNNLHPYSTGYNKMAAVWRGALNSLLPLCSTTPGIISTAGTAAQVEQLYSYDVNAKGYPVPTYRLASAPPGMVINSSTGLIEWTPSSPGAYPVLVEAVNSQGTGTQSFTINVSGAASSNCLPGMLSYWKLDETSGTAFADTAGGRTASFSGTDSPVFAAGKVGGAVDLSGGDQALSTANTTNPTGGITVMAWINPDDLSTRDRGILSKKDAFILEIESTGAEVSFTLLNGGASREFEPDAYSGNDIQVGVWTHVAATFDGTTTSVYINGSAVGSETSTLSAVGSSTTPYSIGWTAQTNFGTNRYFDGRLDEVAVYNRALSAAEIQAQYNLGLSGSNYCSGGP